MTHVEDNKSQELPDIGDMSEAELDAELEQYLDGQSSVSVLYQSEAHALPAAHIDSKVLFAARQRAEEVAEQIANGGAFNWLNPTRWFGQGMLMPAATACGVVGVASAMFMLQPVDSMTSEPVPASSSRNVDDSAPIFNSPQQYVQAIREYRQSGNLDEADRLVRDMSRIYPNQAVPADIRSRIDD